MKNLIVIAVILVSLFSCEKQASPKLAPQLNFKDVVLVNKSKDEEVVRRVAARKKPCPPNNPNCQTAPPDNPPPTGTGGCILLDFDGQNVTQTLWNVNGDFYCEASGLSATGVTDVITKCRLYYAFNAGVTITTDESLFYSFPVNKRIRVIVTATMPSGYEGTGGVAYINSFNWFEDAPCFVNSSGLQYNSKYIADASSHESGHTLDLRHHSEWQYNEDGSCYMISEYLWGDLIMGASYNSSSPRFGIGSINLGCNIIQNDTLIINQSIRL